MKEIIDHLKKVAIQDFRDFFYPFVFVTRLIRSLVTAAFHTIKSRWSHDKKDDQ